MHTKIAACLNAINQVVLGKEMQVKLALTCLLARGHLLLEDLPGMGKTTLSYALAKVLGLNYARVQFTSDLLPGDIIGTSVFEQSSGKFVFHAGPIFTELLLADEINRTTPKTQSALLEAMEERQVTIDGQTRQLPTTFFVIATQNPSNSSGTFALPDSQLDRFLMRISLGYPAHAAEKSLLLKKERSEHLDELEPLLNAAELLEIQQQIPDIRVSDSLLDYILRLVDFSRTNAQYGYGLSPRASIALLNAAKAWATIARRDYVIPEDVQAVLPFVATHRLQDNSGALIAHMLSEVAVL